MNDRPLKKEARVLGVDDGPYVRGSDETLIVLTVYRMDGHIDGVFTGRITTDGDDSAQRIAELISESKYGPQIRCIISDGACLAGFNVLDMDQLHDLTGLPIITSSDETPDTPSITGALKTNFGDWERRLKLILDHGPHELHLPDGICYVREKGISPDDADEIIRRCTIRGRTPEPIRISHMIAAAVHKERRGK
jgi:endonuclease V-like protein UPF0215 family